MKIVLFGILIFWLIKVSRDVLFWAYLWQLKEYRLDRMRAHFELGSARGIFFNKLFGAKLLFLASSFLLFWGIWQFFFQIIASLFYVAFGARSITATYQKKIKEPVFTKKAMLLCGVAAVPIAAAGFGMYAKASSVSFLFGILLLDMLVPLIVAGVVGLLKFPSELMKNRIVERAKTKRRELKDLLVIGVTGSYGKTSVKEYLDHMLKGKLRVVKTRENHNTEMAIAQTLLREVTPESDVFIVEMGAYKEGEIAKVCDIVRPQIGILTGINEQHMSLFGSLEQTIKAKYELIESLPKNGLAIFNGDNDYTHELYEKTTIPKRMYALRSFSVNARPDITSEKISFSRSGTQFYVRLQDERQQFEVPVLGKHNVLNLLGAILAAQSLGMTLEEIKERVKTLPVPPHTLALAEGINGSTIIDDSYTANPRGVAAALDVLDALKGKKKILVLYPLIELGDAASTMHRRIGVKINKVCDVCILTSADFAREIKKNASNTDVLIIPDPQMAIRKLEKILKPEDIVLLENRVPEEIKRAIISPSKS